MLPPPGGRPVPAGPLVPIPLSVSPATALAPQAAAAAPVPAGPPIEGKPPAKVLAKSRRKQRALVLPKAPRIIPEAEKVALATLEAELGGRPSLIVKLAHAQLDADGHRFVQMAADPQNDQLSLAEICDLSNTPIRKVMECVKAALTIKSSLLAVMHVAERLPDVALGVMNDAIPGKRNCGMCQGTGTIETPGKDDEPPSIKPCGVCRGRGQVDYAPELGVRKVALTLGGMLAPGGKGANVSITNNTMAFAGVSAASAVVDRMTEVTDRLLYGVGRDRLAQADQDADEEFVDTEVVPAVPQGTGASE